MTMLRVPTETIMLGASAAGWALLVLGGPTTLSLPDLCTGRLIASIPSGAELTYALAWLSPSALTASWALMVVAMMLPLVGSPLAHVRNRSFTKDRASAILAFISGYLAIWMVGGVVLVGFSLLARLSLTKPSLPALTAFTLAVVWQVTPWKQIALNRCHIRPPLAVFGRGPLRAGLRYGMWHGLWCVVSCAPIMLVALLAATHGDAIMVLAAIWIWAERIEPPRAPSRGLILPRRAVHALFHHMARSFRHRMPGAHKLVLAAPRDGETGAN